MIVLLSPAKSLDFENPSPQGFHTQPEMLPYAEKLMQVLKKKSAKKLMDLMSISENLAELNFQRNQQWKVPFSQSESKQAIFAFTGDVYTGFDANTLDEKNVEFTQNTLRILSGLYGVLKPFDLIKPYRLEMGTSLKVGSSKNLYQFWGDKITEVINTHLAQLNTSVVVNLASNEYFNSVNTKKLKASLVTPQFLDLKNGKYKTLSFFAKKARGKMARFIVDEKITDADHLKAFDGDGYLWNAEKSTKNQLIFTR